MQTLIQRYGRTLLTTGLTSVIVAGIAVGSAAALASSGPTPPPAGPSLSTLQLEVAWARLQAGHARAAVMFQFADQRTAQVQSLIDQAKATGKDVTGLQRALDKLEAALQQAQPIFDGASSTFTSHPGFDAAGKVTDPTSARQTVTEVAAQDKQIQAILGPAQRGFRLAQEAFRQSGGIAPRTAEASDLRLELAWARLQAAHARLQALLEFADQRTAEAQQLIDRAQANGKDVGSIQTALTGLETAIQQARPTFQGTNGILTAHPGFDDSGNVANATQAMQTVKDLGSTFQQIGSTLKPAQQDFQQALQALRQTNIPTQPSPTPSS